MDGPGHSLENCFLLKHKIQDLIDSDQLKFRIVPPAGPNIAGNPLPAHGERKVNAIREGRRLVRRVEHISTPLERVFAELIRRNLIITVRLPVSQRITDDPTRGCPYHQGIVGHTLYQCTAFKRMVQELMDQGVIIFEKAFDPPGDDGATSRLHMGDVDTITIIDVAPTVITYDPEVARAAVEPIVILTPSSFPYESDKAVPWNYEAKVMNPAKTEPVANIAGVGGMTRSGRCYTPEELERRRGTLVGEDIVEGTHRKEPVTDAEVAEFKKVVKRSEFNIVEKLNRTPARISLLSLLLSFLQLWQ